MAESARHLDLLRLDALRAGDNTDPADAHHVAGCAHCRVALAELTGLAADLKALHAPALEPSTDRDAQILWRGGSEAARVRRQPRRTWRRAVPAPAVWAAAAVAVLALASVVMIGRRQAVPNQLTRVASTSPLTEVDIDRDGRVTVLDAFLLAREMETRRDAAVDVNRDALVDQLDVDTVLAMAVSVGGA